MARVSGVSGGIRGAGGGGLGVSSRIACAISVPLLLMVYLVYRTVGLFLEASRLPDVAVIPSPNAGDKTLSFGEPVRGDADWGDEFIALNPEARLPNKGRSKGTMPTRITGDFGTRSRHYGEIQRERQEWLIAKAEELRSGTQETNGVDDVASYDREGGGGAEPSARPSATSGAIDGETASVKVGVRSGEARTAASADGVAATGGAGWEERAEAGEKSGNRDGGGENNQESAQHRRRELSRLNKEHRQKGRVDGSLAIPSGTVMALRNDTDLDYSRVADAEAEAEEEPLRAETGEVVIVFPALAKTAALGVATPRERSTEGSRLIADGGVVGERRLSARGKGDDSTKALLEERLKRLERGVDLWGATYVPPIESTWRRDLVEKWSAKGRGELDGRDDKMQEPIEKVQGRILYVVSSFDRGDRLGKIFRRRVDKLDYVLMMFDEMREACEAGFWPQVHLIAAWNLSSVAELAADRLFCKRINRHVPLSYEEHPHSIGNGLSVKHRAYMKSRVEDFDVFLQVEDDMVLTLNHIMLYQEESERLKHRRGLQNRVDEEHIPGFIRVEPGGERGGAAGSEEEWFEWEILLSRFRPIKLAGAGTYIGLDDSKVLKGGRNNQGLWMATRWQLEKLRKKCKYLEYDGPKSTANAQVESLSGSLEMFTSKCGFRKVFPARHFEDFLVHHRTNNKNGLRGESIPAVPMSMLRVWAEQFVRDESMLLETKR